MLQRARFYYYILRGALSRFYRGHSCHREGAIVRKIYNNNYACESNAAFLRKKGRVYVGGKLTAIPVWEYKRTLLRRFSVILQHFGAESVLELGSGRGLNLLALVALVPALTEAIGIELSDEGVRVAERNAAHPPFEELMLLTGLSREEIAGRIAGVRFRFIRGSITGSHLPPRSVDAVFSNSVIEQLPEERDYMNAFREAARAARKVAFFSEPFAEAQGRNLFYKMYLKQKDMFRFSYATALRAGLKKVSFEIPPVQKFEFNTGILVCVPSS